MGVHEKIGQAGVVELTTTEKVARARQGIRVLLEAGRPLAVAYSAGKDSSVLMALVFDAAIEAKAAGTLLPSILVTHANTGIENPAYQQVANAEIGRIEAFAARNGLPLRVDVTEPALNDSWAVRIISGRALPTFANSATRDCTISWKIKPQERQRKRALKELGESGAPVILVGTRFEESVSRAKRMSERGETDLDVWQEEVLNAAGKVVRVEDRMSPLAFWTQEDIWVYLSDLVHGRHESYTDAVAVWEAYQDGGNSSCAVVGDDAMKAASKACGARFGCALCTAVGRDRSLENMIEADPKYAYLRNLNRLQRFLVDSQYDKDRRNWLGRTINDKGFVAIAPDTYSPSMLKDLLYFALSIDFAEAAAAARAGVAPRFQLISPAALIAIDAIWSAQGIFERPFEAIRVFHDVALNGNLRFPPVDYVAPEGKSFPQPKYLYVGNDWDNEDRLGDYTGLRSLEADLVSAGESGCIGTRTLKNGRVVMDITQSDLFDIDNDGAMDFLCFEAERKVTDTAFSTDPTEGYRYYLLLGLLSTSTKHLSVIDKMMRRTNWKARQGVIGASPAELLSRSVTKEEMEGFNISHV